VDCIGKSRHFSIGGGAGIGQTGKQVCENGGDGKTKTREQQE
jgi:hypothetical protein